MGAPVHVRIIIELRTHIDVAKKPTYVEAGRIGDKCVIKALRSGSNRRQMRDQGP